MEKIVESKAKCPKCKNKDHLQLIEVWDGHGITWEVEDGKFDRNDGSLEAGDPYKVCGRCYKCNHRWTFKGALQIDNIIKD